MGESDGFSNPPSYTIDHRAVMEQKYPGSNRESDDWDQGKQNTSFA